MPKGIGLITNDLFPLQDDHMPLILPIMMHLIERFSFSLAKIAVILTAVFTQLIPINTIFTLLLQSLQGFPGLILSMPAETGVLDIGRCV